MPPRPVSDDGGKSLLSRIMGVAVRARLGRRDQRIRAAMAFLADGVSKYNDAAQRGYRIARQGVPWARTRDKQIRRLGLTA